MKFLLKSLHFGRGFFGKSIVLEPGVEQAFPKDTVEFLKARCEQFKSHVQSGEIEIRGASGGNVTLFLRSVTALGKRRPPTPYCAHELFLKANSLANPNDVNEVTQAQYDRLSVDPCFTSLVGSEILVVGAKE